MIHADFNASGKDGFQTSDSDDLIKVMRLRFFYDHFGRNVHVDNGKIIKKWLKMIIKNIINK